MGISDECLPSCKRISGGITARAPPPWMKQGRDMPENMGPETSFLNPPPLGWNKGRDTAENSGQKIHFWTPLPLDGTKGGIRLKTELKKYFGPLGAEKQFCLFSLGPNKRGKHLEKGQKIVFCATPFLARFNGRGPGIYLGFAFPSRKPLGDVVRLHLCSLGHKCDEHLLGASLEPLIVDCP